MILNILRELLEKDFDSITSSIKIQNVDFHVGKHTPINQQKEEKCLWAYAQRISIVVFEDLIEINNIVLKSVYIYK